MVTNVEGDNDLGISEPKSNEIENLLRLYHYQEIIFEPIKLSKVYGAASVNGVEDNYIVFSILARVNNSR